MSEIDICDICKIDGGHHMTGCDNNVPQPDFKDTMIEEAQAKITSLQAENKKYKDLHDLAKGRLNKAHEYTDKLEAENKAGRKLAELILNAHSENLEYKTRCDLARDVLKGAK